MGVRQAASTVRADRTYEADRRAYVERGRYRRNTAASRCPRRHQNMAVLADDLPVEQQAATCYAALQRSADTAVATGDSRTRDQIMADTLVATTHSGNARLADQTHRLP